MKNDIEKADAEDSGNKSRIERESERRPFNPMKTYFYVAASILVAYGLFYLFGYIALITIMLFFLMGVFSETIYTLRNISYGLPRKAAYFNVTHATVFFFILAINGYWMMQHNEFLILPEIDQLTFLSPLFIMMAVFGMRNIRLMYVPDRNR